MKGPAVIAKNLKLLFRSRETAFTIVFGPLLIILLVSAAYTGGDTDTQLHVGAYSPEYTALADDIISALNEKGYRVSVFANESMCTDMIKTGQVHTCVLFPSDFSIKEDESQVVRFAVDYSRINLVYEIIDGLSQEFQVQSTSITEELTSDVLQRLALAQEEVHDQLATGEGLETKLDLVQSEMAESRSSLGSVDVNVSFADLKDIRGRVTGLSGMITEIKAESIDAIEAAEATLRDARSEVENETRDSVDDTMDLLENATATILDIADDAPTAVTEVNYIIDDAADAMEKVQERFGQLVSASEEVDDRLATSKGEIDTALSELTTLRGKLQHVDRSLQEVLGFQASSVAAPITTRIEPVTSEDSNLTFTYPYVLMLVIMFLGLMLSSSLIVMDKTSNAAFRNFTTATRDEYHILFSFITTFFILLGQTLIILLVSYFFVKAPLFNNFAVSLVVIFFAITLFSFLGMIIGYVAGTQEAAMISSLSLGSVLLFVSNLVLPLEAMNQVVSILSSYNPYVVLSELLKQSMLFNLRLVDTGGRIGLLVLTILILFGLIIAVQRSFKSKFFQRRSKDLAANAFAPRARKIKPLSLMHHEVKDLFDLLEVLDHMTRADFEQVIAGGKNPIAAWVRLEVGEKGLARRMDTRSKERMILALDKYIKRRSKRLQKKK